MTGPRTDVWLENLLDERDGAALYEGLARVEKDPARAHSFAELAEGERRHAAIWQRKLEAAGVALPPDRPSPRVRTLVWLAGRLGTSSVLPLISQTEATDAAKYARQGGEAAALVAEEEAHREVLAGLRGHAVAVPEAEREKWHTTGRAGNVRAAVFGMNDGLVSNLALVLGVAGTGAQSQTLVVTGLAGLLAGAASMAVGEYVSVASQRDLLKRQIELERRELSEAPEEEAKELAAIFEKKGISKEQAERTTRELVKNPDAALDTLVREELGLDPDDLGSPLGAAGASFVMFAIGAVMPILPFLFARGSAALYGSMALCGAVLAGVGGLLGFLSGTNPLRSGARMVALAAAAAGLTFGLGKLFGTTLS